MTVLHMQQHRPEPARIENRRWLGPLIVLIVVVWLAAWKIWDLVVALVEWTGITS